MSFAAVQAASSADADTALSGCSSIVTLARDSAIRVLCLEDGADSSLLSAMRTHVTDAAVCDKACRGLYNCLPPGSWWDVDVGLSAIPTLLAVLRAHPTNERACFAATSVFESLTSPPQDSVLCDTCETVGVLPAVLAVLKAHGRSSAPVCEAVSCVLMRIATDRACVAANADDACAVVSALRTHLALAGVCRAMCRVLSRLSSSKTFRASCVSAGVIPLIVAVLHRHIAEGRVCFSASRTLNFLAYDHYAYKGACEDAGAVPALVAVARTHVAAPSEEAVATLKELGYTATGARLIRPLPRGPIATALFDFLVELVALEDFQFHLRHYKYGRWAADLSALDLFRVFARIDRLGRCVDLSVVAALPSEATSISVLPAQLDEARAAMASLAHGAYAGPPESPPVVVESEASVPKKPSDLGVWASSMTRARVNACIAHVGEFQIRTPASRCALATSITATHERSSKAVVALAQIAYNLWPPHLLVPLAV